MDNIKAHFDQFDYKEKSFALKAADFCNQGLYAYLENKHIELYQDIHAEPKYTQITSRPLAVALLISLMAFPLLLFTLSFKLLSREQATLQAKFKNLAANKIQKAFRAYATRRNLRICLKNKRDKKITLDKIETKKIFKTYLIQQKQKKLRSISKIQKAFRAYKTRRDLRICLKNKRDKKIAFNKIRTQENFKIHLSHTKAIQNRYILFRRMKNKIKNKVEKYLPDPSQRAQLIQEGVVKVEQAAVNFLCRAFMTQVCYVVGLDPTLVQETIDIEKFQKTYHQ